MVDVWTEEDRGRDRVYFKREFVSTLSGSGTSTSPTTVVSDPWSRVGTSPNRFGRRTTDSPEVGCCWHGSGPLRSLCTVHSPLRDIGDVFPGALPCLVLTSPTRRPHRNDLGTPRTEEWIFHPHHSPLDDYSTPITL